MRIPRDSSVVSELPTAFLALPVSLFGSVPLYEPSVGPSQLFLLSSSPSPWPGEAPSVWSIVPRASHLGLLRSTSGSGHLDAAGFGFPTLPFLPFRALMVCDHLALWSQRSAAQAGGRRLHAVVRLGLGTRA